MFLALELSLTSMHCETALKHRCQSQLTMECPELLPKVPSHSGPGLEVYHRVLQHRHPLAWLRRKPMQWQRAVLPGLEVEVPVLAHHLQCQTIIREAAADVKDDLPDMCTDVLSTTKRLSETSVKQ